MTDFLYFRQAVGKMKGGQLLFAILRLREGLAWDFKALEKKGPFDILLAKHIQIQHFYWDEAWWCQLRDYSKTPLFRTVRKYI
jgi:hypothetical protein